MESRAPLRLHRYPVRPVWDLRPLVRPWPFERSSEFRADPIRLFRRELFRDSQSHPAAVELALTRLPERPRAPQPGRRAFQFARQVTCLVPQDEPEKTASEQPEVIALALTTRVPFPVWF